MKDLSNPTASMPSLTDQLKRKSRRRRDDLGRMAQAASPPLLRNDLLPLLVIVAVAFTVFWIDPEDLSSKASIGVTCLLAAIAFQLAEAGTREFHVHGSWADPKVDTVDRKFGDDLPKLLDAPPAAASASAPVVR